GACLYLARRASQWPKTTKPLRIFCSWTAIDPPISKLAHWVLPTTGALVAASLRWRAFQSYSLAGVDRASSLTQYGWSDRPVWIQRQRRIARDRTQRTLNACAGFMSLLSRPIEICGRDCCLAPK